MKNQSSAIFHSNLLFLNKKFSSMEEMASYLKIPVGTLKCWMAKKRVPNLKQLNLLADNMGCYTYNLLIFNGCLEDIGVHNRDIHKVFLTRLNMAFIEKQARGRISQLSLLNHVITEDTLNSYFRNKDYHLPSLRTLDKIADELGLPSYKLIEEVSEYEKNKPK